MNQNSTVSFCLICVNVTLILDPGSWIVHHVKHIINLLGSRLLKLGILDPGSLGTLTGSYKLIQVHAVLPTCNVCMEHLKFEL